MSGNAGYQGDSEEDLLFHRLLKNRQESFPYKVQGIDTSKQHKKKPFHYKAIMKWLPNEITFFAELFTF